MSQLNPRHISTPLITATGHGFAVDNSDIKAWGGCLLRHDGSAWVKNDSANTASAVLLEVVGDDYLIMDAVPLRALLPGAGSVFTAGDILYAADDGDLTATASGAPTARYLGDDAMLFLAEASDSAAAVAAIQTNITALQVEEAKHVHIDGSTPITGEQTFQDRVHIINASPNYQSVVIEGTRVGIEFRDTDHGVADRAHSRIDVGGGLTQLIRVSDAYGYGASLAVFNHNTLGVTFGQASGTTGNGKVNAKGFQIDGVDIATTAGGGPADTDALPEGAANLYYTDARVTANSTVQQALTNAATADTKATTATASAATALAAATAAQTSADDVVPKSTGGTFDDDIAISTTAGGALLDIVTTSGRAAVTARGTTYSRFSARHNGAPANQQVFGFTSQDGEGEIAPFDDANLKLADGVRVNNVGAVMIGDPAGGFINTGVINAANYYKQGVPLKEVQTQAGSTRLNQSLTANTWTSFTLGFGGSARTALLEVRNNAGTASRFDFSDTNVGTNISRHNIAASSYALVPVSLPSPVGVYWIRRQTNTGSTQVRLYGFVE